MAKSEKKPKVNREPGRFAQLWSVYKMTAKVDKSAVWWSALALSLGVLAGVALGVWLAPTNGFLAAVYIFTGSLSGLLSGLIVMSKRAERAAYSRIEGQPGAVGAVLGSSLRRNWQAADMPVAMNPKTKEAIYRAVGPAGVVLIGEGARTRVQSLLEDERRKINRIAPGAPVHFIFVSGDEGSTPLHRLAPTLYKLKKGMSRSEITAVRNRLASMGMSLPIPKGIDPTKVRAQRR